MAKILNMKSYNNGIRYIIEFELESPSIAKSFEASCLMAVREIHFFTDLYSKGSFLYLDSPNEEKVNEIGKRLKRTIESK